MLLPSSMTSVEIMSLASPQTFILWHAEGRDPSWTSLSSSSRACKSLSMHTVQEKTVHNTCNLEYNNVMVCFYYQSQTIM